MSPWDKDYPSNYTVSIFSVGVKKRFLPSNQTPKERIETVYRVNIWCYFDPKGIIKLKKLIFSIKRLISLTLLSLSFFVIVT